jgi:prolyl-tRNA editing enzyme YbaK/EbsC (Cys-tRNA(Pro) deacylase)
MRHSWPEPVERVSRFLCDAGAEARIEEFPDGTPTAGDAARAIGCPPGHIVKSMVVECGRGAVLAMVPGNRRVDLAKVAAAAGTERARIGTPDVVRELTGFEPGAVAPFPLPRITVVFVDRALLSLPVVWVGAGSDHHMAGIAPAELVRLTRAEPRDIVVDD